MSGELVRWLCVLAERGYTTWPPLHYFAFVSKFQVSDFRADEVHLQPHFEIPCWSRAALSLLRTEKNYTRWR